MSTQSAIVPEFEISQHFIDDECRGFLIIEIKFCCFSTKLDTYGDPFIQSYIGIGFILSSVLLLS